MLHIHCTSLLFLEHLHAAMYLYSTTNMYTVRQHDPRDMDVQVGWEQLQTRRGPETAMDEMGATNGQSGSTLHVATFKL